MLQTLLHALVALQIAGPQARWPDRGLAAIGLDRLRWGMSSESVAEQFSGKTIPAASSRGADTDLLRGRAATVVLADCTYAYKMLGRGGALSAIEAELAPGNERVKCADNLKLRLKSYFPVGLSIKDGGEKIIWDDYGERLDVRSSPTSLGFVLISPGDTVLTVQ